MRAHLPPSRHVDELGHFVLMSPPTGPPPTGERKGNGGGNGRGEGREGGKKLPTKGSYLINLSWPTLCLLLRRCEYYGM